MKKTSFCEKKFHSMLLTGTFTMAVLYIMLLCDNIIAGIFIGSKGVAAINAVTPISEIVTFLSTVISAGTGILYSRAIGAFDKRRADELYGQGMIVSVAIAVACAVLLWPFRGIYFDVMGVSGEIYDLAMIYYSFTPLNAALSVMTYYLSEMVYADGDENCNNVSYLLQIGGNIIFSVFLARAYGMIGIILGSVIGNVLGLIILIWHYFKKSNTLHFVWHFSFDDSIECIKFSIVDALIYLCWGIVDYILIGHVAARYGESGQVMLAVVINLIEFGVVMDGVGMAVQPLIGTYYGEKNHVMVKRLMKYAVRAALVEGIAAGVLTFACARWFCGLFGISGELLVPCMRAVRIVSLGMVFCSAVSLLTSYYMLVDHIGISVGITILKEGVFYTILPLLGSVLLGETGMWAAFALTPVLALGLSFIFIRVHFGREGFPYALEKTDTEIIVLDDTLTPEHCAELSEKVANILRERNFEQKTIVRAAMFAEEIGLCIIERNKESKPSLLVELSLLFDPGSVLMIERDSGEIFDITDPDMEVKGISSFILSGLMQAQSEKSYLTTTGYNRNMIRFKNQGANEYGAAL